MWSDVSLPSVASIYFLSFSGCLTCENPAGFCINDVGKARDTDDGMWPDSYDAAGRASTSKVFLSVVLERAARRVISANSTTALALTVGTGYSVT
jgi:hypothetical protein